MLGLIEGFSTRLEVLFLQIVQLNVLLDLFDLALVNLAFGETRGDHKRAA